MSWQEAVTYLVEMGRWRLSSSYRSAISQEMKAHLERPKLSILSQPGDTAESTKPKDRQLRAHFDLFIDRDARYPGYILTDAAWQAFKKSETHGKARLAPEELALAEPLFGAKWGYEITIQSLWQELAEWWSNGWGWDAPLRATILDVYRDWQYDREGKRFKGGRGNRVYLRALFKVCDSIRDRGFVEALMAYTGLSREAKERYVGLWMARNNVAQPSTPHALATIVS